MPIIKSARKRVKVATKANIRNAKTKRSMREAIKAFTKALSAGGAKDIAAAEKAAISAIDKAAKKDVIHKNKAARQKARLAGLAKAAGAKTEKKSKPAAKPQAASKPAAKKTAVKKPAAKKPAAKKTAK